VGVEMGERRPPPSKNGFLKFIFSFRVEIWQSRKGIYHNREMIL